MTQQVTPTDLNQQVSQPTTSNFVFDENNIPPEIARYVDRQRQQASQTAMANARKKLMKDEEFLSEIRNGMQPEVQHTVEEQLAQLRRDTNIDRASAKVERILAKAGISETDMETYLPMLVTENMEDSIARAENFISALNKTIEGRISKEKQTAMQSMTTPQSSANSISEQQALQTRLDEARKDNSYKRDIIISSIMREASEKGIVLY